MRSVLGKIEGVRRRTVARVTSLAELPAVWDPNLSWLVKVNCQDDVKHIGRFAQSGVSGLHMLVAGDRFAHLSPCPVVQSDTDLVHLNDVVALTPGRPEIQVLFRETDLHHTVFLTNRCNSYCLMCSQPPTLQDDSWLTDEAISIAKHIGHSPDVIGFSGGEPLLLGERLREILDWYGNCHPNTRLEVLTNGRLLSDRKLAGVLLRNLTSSVAWMVPLYGHADFLHDFVVQCEGAFDQTINGLLTLREFSQPIQLRVVLIEPVLKTLPELCRFITRNLPFVTEIALMNTEPIGFALANRKLCEVNMRNWHAELLTAVNILRTANLDPVLMNLPLCALPRELWRFANRSISDWKQVYIPECNNCLVKRECCGLFAWHQRGWRPAPVMPVTEATYS